ncbi:CRISPR-associated protein Cas4 [Vagococcus lutrae]|uniref:CRISPR-associated protein Cas4 n=1 Tax=Vagococcus lutrae TaxID=81947 RepID=UPI00288DB408|nr:CRISPR-associated protein Cas4 [Vagococcus lutrae]MDT2826393.1 CRISPR-associated protein Cas4 [Vagococcus lutrae]
MKITGTMMNYYFICERKLWLFTHDLKFEKQNENVLLGKLIDQGTYQSKRKQIMLDETINIDFIEDWKVIHEVKKSRAMEKSSEWQVKYYIYYLRNKGINIEKGILDYPKLRQIKEVYLTKDDEQHLEEIIADIQRIKETKDIPDVIHSKICSKCAYFEYCYS